MGDLNSVIGCKRNSRGERKAKKKFESKNFAIKASETWEHKPVSQEKHIHWLHTIDVQRLNGQTFESSTRNTFWHLSQTVPAHNQNIYIMCARERERPH